MILLDILPKGESVNADRYCETLDRLRHAVRSKRPGLLRSEVVLQHDNATPHTAKRTKRYRWDIIRHPAHSPDLAISDFHLFGPLKLHLGGKKFEDEDELIAHMKKFDKKFLGPLTMTTSAVKSQKMIIFISGGIFISIAEPSLFLSHCFANITRITKITSTYKGEAEGVPTVLVAFQGAGCEIFELRGTVAGNKPIWLSVQGSHFNIPASLSGNAVVYRTQDSAPIADILAAAAKDGIEVSAMSASTLWKNQSFGIINAASPVPNGLKHLSQVAGNAYACVL
ncbi:histone-lysine N-methyltransferase SETMAR [Plakobranchus ocellatus]|uniref:Histone-lysine N-methyltransferase SETMAR n=1 Tax=Plakobranchus ocellatus TaxID=259542 RepID=A0AAV3YCH5_9GAST|nr:histone-lysine N-methyltransferase SETMAR [Plakobranchus ocellatus]